MRKIILITVFMALLLFSVIFSTQMVPTVCGAIKVENQDKTEWPMFRHDLRRTGYTDDPGPDSNQTRWNYRTLLGADVISSPAVVGDKVYVGSWDDNLYCFDVFTGRVVWKYATGGWIESSPAVADGRVYVGSWDDQVYCLNASNGDFIWNYTTGDDVVSSPAVSEGMVYVGSDDYFVYCLNASTGDLIWNYTTGLFVKSSPAVAYGRVYISSADDYLYCLDAYNGSLKWRYRPLTQIVWGEKFFSSPAVVDGRVYIGSWTDYVYCLNAYNGSKIWNFTAGNWVESSPAVVNGKVYVGSWDNNFYCLNASDGDLIWNYTMGDDVDSSPAVAGGMVYVGSEDNYVYCFDSFTGDLIWKYETGGDVDSSPAVAGGAVYIGSDDGYVYCFGFRFFNVFTIVWSEETYYVTTFSNSTVSEPNFSQTEMRINFNVTSSTPSFCNITIPKRLLNATQDDWLIRVNGEPISYGVTENRTHTFLYLTYEEGNHTVEVVGTWAVPDFPASMILPLLLIITLIAVILAKKNAGSARGFSGT